MKFRINFTYTYDVDPTLYPPEVRQHPRLMVEHESQFVPEIIQKAIEEKKKGILLTMDVLEERAVDPD